MYTFFGFETRQITLCFITGFYDPTQGTFGVNTLNECPDCHRTYKTKAKLNRHIKFECNKEPSFLCMFCPYKAKRKDNLQTHIVLKHSQHILS